MKKNKINFSVIINCFNGEKFIESCLLSLKDQTYKNFEIIFFDNNSSDKSVNIFLKNVFNKNFYLHRNKLTISLAEARVEAIKFAKADHHFDDKEKQLINDVVNVFKKGEETVLVIERKSLKDLYQSIKDGRHREQKKRLFSTYPKSKIIFLVEGNIYDSDFPDKIVKIIQSSILNTIIRDNIRIIETCDISDTFHTLKQIFDKLHWNFTAII